MATTPAPSAVGEGGSAIALVLAGRAPWMAVLPADDPTELLRGHSVPRLRELGEIVDACGRPWREKTRGCAA
jgi:tagatose-1,6-bisphosphate aldolase